MLLHMKNLFVAYYRVSTNHQGMNGLGMEAQKAAVRNFLNGGSWELLGEFAEVESGKRKDRPELDKAIALCRKTKAQLLIAKLDRLARNAAFLLNLRDSGVDFVAVDMPHADKFTVGIMALVAEKERDLISQRTKDGLAAAKRRGTRLGNPNPSKAWQLAVAANQQKATEHAAATADVIKQITKAGVTSLRGIAECLNRRGFKTPNGKAFFPQSVKNVLARCRDSTGASAHVSANKGLPRAKAGQKQGKSGANTGQFSIAQKG
jgi:DNA invertase Pin-like site-specific DNA recombinase